ncbi:DUF1579 domain-containing protein [Agrilutibacter solisilvae]|uniref:DUF1579 domain-containing protein n=1 Tax=Agrilutibacter solisilvae TaxID=2763317 RepID=A0A974Y1H7_9GAMM|nr:DUF1579 domain-containing protein [Lysobacter solisilvae]QSX78813.1 DUF1579 domain-containing protein [Lysobacter solisilvae]
MQSRLMPKPRRPLSATLCLWAAMALPSIAAAQENAPAAPPMSPEQQAMMQAWQKASTPGEPHQRLAQQFAGTWNTRQSMWMEPSAAPSIETGTAVNTAIYGGRQLRMDYKGAFMGQPYEGLGFSGYDNIKGKYVSSWMDNMSTSVFLAEGDYDPATRTYTYRGQMPDPMKPGIVVPVRNVVRVVDKDHHVFEMHETRDGKEVKTMQIEYTRAK